MRAPFGRIIRPMFGPRLAVEADGEISPTDIAGLKLWYDFSDATKLFTDAGSTPVVNDGDVIYQANDKSGNSKHATQATEENRPLYKVNIQNSFAAGLFDANDLMDIPADIGISGSDNRTIIFVGKATVTDKYFYAFGRSATAETFRMRYRSTESNGLRVELYGSGYATSLTGLDSWKIHTAILDGTKLEDITLYINEDSESCVGANVVNTDTSVNTLGAGDVNGASDFVGYMGELIVYDSALTGVDWTNILSYINAKWAIY